MRELTANRVRYLRKVCILQRMQRIDWPPPPGPPIKRVKPALPYQCAADSHRYDRETTYRLPCSCSHRRDRTHVIRMVIRNHVATFHAECESLIAGGSALARVLAQIEAQPCCRDYVAAGYRAVKTGRKYTRTEADGSAVARARAAMNAIVGSDAADACSLVSHVHGLRQKRDERTTWPLDEARQEKAKKLVGDVALAKWVLAFTANGRVEPPVEAEADDDDDEDAELLPEAPPRKRKFRRPERALVGDLSSAGLFVPNPYLSERMHRAGFELVLGRFDARRLLPDVLAYPDVKSPVARWRPELGRWIPSESQDWIFAGRRCLACGVDIDSSHRRRHLPSKNHVAAYNRWLSQMDKILPRPGGISTLRWSPQRGR